MKNPCIYARRKGDPMRCVSPGEVNQKRADLYEILIKIQQFFMDYNLIIISLLSKNVRIRTTNLL